MPLNPSYSEFNQIIMDAGYATATTPKYRRVGWFENDKENLQPLMLKKSELLHKIRNSSDPLELETLKATYKLACKETKDRTELAKKCWAIKLGNEVNELNVTPKQAWQAAYEIRDGVKGHHTTPAPKIFKDVNGKLATTKEENINNVETHFTKVFNSTRPFDPEAVEAIPQRETMHEIGEPPTWEEFKRAIFKLKNDKKPGKNGVMPNAFKCLDNHNLSVIFQFLTDFWTGESDYDEWHESIGSLVPKKGDLQNLNKWRCINLMDVGSKILSCILTERAYKLLEKHGVKWQFGATPLVGCPEGSFSLKTLLHLRHQHNLPSYVAYVDLVKAYDTANHEVLLKLLEKYGAPPQFTDIVRRLYSNLRVIINIDGKALSIPQTSGVRQGDNLSPVLFLFIMSAVAETLDIELEKNNIEKPVCHGVDINNLDKGLLTGQTPRNFSSGRTFKLLEFLYIDDGAFVFGSRANLIKGLKLIRKCFAAFGLEMHIGKNGEASKTECIFYPTSSWFHDTQDNLCLPQNSNTNQTPNTLLLPNASPSPPTDESPTLALEEKKKAESYIKRKARCDIKYDTCEETNRIMLDSEGYVDFTKDFLYLGSSTSYDLRDDQDIARRINIAYPEAWAC